MAAYIGLWVNTFLSGWDIQVYLGLYLQLYMCFKKKKKKMIKKQKSSARLQQEIAVLHWKIGPKRSRCYIVLCV